MEVAVYMVTVKSYFTRESRVHASICLNNDHSEIKINSFHCKAIATRRSILDIVRVPDPPPPPPPLLITIFGKVTFNLTQNLPSCLL